MAEITLARLRRVRETQKEIEDLRRHRDTLYYPIASPRLSSEGHSTTPSDPTARAFDALQKLDDKIAEKIAILAEDEQEIYDWLYAEFGDENNDKQRTFRRIVICHYMQGMNWEQTTRHVLGYYGTESARNYVYRYFDKSETK